MCENYEENSGAVDRYDGFLRHRIVGCDIAMTKYECTVSKRIRQESQKRCVKVARRVVVECSSFRVGSGLTWGLFVAVQALV